MAPKTLNIVYAADAKDLDRVHKAIEQSAGKTGSALERISGKMVKTGTVMTKSVTLPILGVAAAGLKMGADIDSGLREVNSLFGETGGAAEKTFKELQSGVADLSNEIGVAQDEITGGLYQAISAGVPKENAFDFMKIASTAAIAGVTDTETAVDGLTTVMNAFGVDASRAQEVADSMFTAVKGGKLNFEELSASLFQIAPAAAAAGISFDEVNAAIAALTSQGVPTSVATTQMRAAVVELSKEGTKVSDVFKEVAGKTFPEFTAAGGTLEEGLALVKKEADANNSSMLDMFGSVEAGQAALALTGTAAGKFSDELENMTNKAGATKTAAEEIDKSAARKVEKAMTRMKNALVSVTAVLLPILADWAEKLGKVAEKFANLDKKTQKTILVVASIAAAIGPVLIVVGKMIKVGKNLVMVIKAIGIVFRGLSLILTGSPFGLVLLAVVALGVALYQLWKRSETFRNIVTGAFRVVQTVVGSVVSVILSILQGWANTWMSVVGIIVSGAAKAFGWVPGVGGKLKSAAADFETFRTSINEKFESAKTAAQSWGEETEGAANKSKTAVDGWSTTVEESATRTDTALSSAGSRAKQWSLEVEEASASSRTAHDSWRAQLEENNKRAQSSHDSWVGNLKGKHTEAKASQQDWRLTVEDTTGRVISATEHFATRAASAHDSWRSQVSASSRSLEGDTAGTFDRIKANITGPMNAARIGVSVAVNAVIGWFRTMWNRASYYVRRIREAIKSLPFVPGSPIPLVVWTGMASKGMEKKFGEMREQAASVVARMNAEFARLNDPAIRPEITRPGMPSIGSAAEIRAMAQQRMPTAAMAGAGGPGFSAGPTTIQLLLDGRVIASIVEDNFVEKLRSNPKLRFEARSR